VHGAGAAVLQVDYGSDYDRAYPPVPPPPVARARAPEPALPRRHPDPLLRVPSGLVHWARSPWTQGVILIMIILFVLSRLAWESEEQAHTRGRSAGAHHAPSVLSLSYWVGIIGADTGDTGDAGGPMHTPGPGTDPAARPPGPHTLTFTPTRQGAAGTMHFATLPSVRAPSEIGAFSALCSEGDPTAGAAVRPIDVRTGPPADGGPHMEMHFAEGGDGGLVVTLFSGNGENALPVGSACSFSCAGAGAPAGKQ
jgi:hypothetical protein